MTRRRLPILVLMLIFVLGPLAAAAHQATPVATSAEDWPMWGGNPGRTKVSDGTGPTGRPVVLWQGAPEGLAIELDRAALAGGVLYGLGAPDWVVAMDAATGDELWRSQGFGDTVTVDGDGLIVHGNPMGDEVALARISRTDGSVVWSAEKGMIDPSWSPVVAGGVGYIPSGEDFLAFDPATGETVWRVPLMARASRGASVDGGVAVLGDEDGTLYGISTGDGHMLWTYDTDALTVGHPTITNGTAYFNLLGGEKEAFVALDATTGELKWSFVSPTGEGFLTAAVDRTTVYAPTFDGHLYALDAATGEQLWDFRTGPGAANSPAVVSGTLYEDAESGVAYAIDPATGTELWRMELDASATPAAIVGGGVFYLSTSLGTIYAISGTPSIFATPSG